MRLIASRPQVSQQRPVAMLPSRVPSVLRTHAWRRSFSTAAAATATIDVDVSSIAATEAAAMAGSATERRKATPAEMDATRFELDPSVTKWQWFSPRTDVSEAARAVRKAPTLQETLSKIAASASQDTLSAAYWAYHSSRFGFFITQALGGLIAHNLSQRGGPQSEMQVPAGYPFTSIFNNFSTESVTRAWEGYGTWEQDLDNIRLGIYKAPWDMQTLNRQFNPFVMASRTLTFIRESTATLQRHVLGQRDDVWLQSPSFPQYYKNGFHYQTDGWLSDKSANIYEHSTETLFLGRQDAMQRSALVPISEYVCSASKLQSEMRLLEVAAGTGRFHTFLKDNFPDISSVCSDLSPFYLQRARDNMQEWKQLRQPNRSLGGVDNAGVEYIQMAAEKLEGMADESFDVVCSVYLFHELPLPVRTKAVAEFLRVLRPGGLCVLTDSAQLGDRPEWDTTMGRFTNFNEPHYTEYISSDLGGLFEKAGFVPGKKWVISATKTLSFTKPL